VLGLRRPWAVPPVGVRLLCRNEVHGEEARMLVDVAILRTMDLGGFHRELGQQRGLVARDVDDHQIDWKSKSRVPGNRV
jgi:hypothetical protein